MNQIPYNFENKKNKKIDISFFVVVVFLWDRSAV